MSGENGEQELELLRRRTGSGESKKRRFGLGDMPKCESELMSLAIRIDVSSFSASSAISLENLSLRVACNSKERLLGGGLALRGDGLGQITYERDEDRKKTPTN